MESFNRQNLKDLDKDIMDALAAVAKKHNLNVKLAGGSFDAVESTVRIKFTTKNANNPEANPNLKLAIARYNLPNDIIGQTFMMKHTEYKVVGFNLNKPKFAVSIQRVSDNKPFGTTVQAVKNALKLPA